MPHIVLDTETTGIDPRVDKIVEIGAVNLDTGATFHVYCNPGIPVPAEATAIHGLTDEFLAQHPPFQAEPLLAFIGDATLIAHNAPFDCGFLQAALGYELPNPVIDTLALARKKHAGSQCSLDALCRRYGIDTAARTKHGALLDAQLLAEVYIELLGRQSALTLTTAEQERVVVTVGARPRPLATRLTEQEAQVHTVMVASLPGAIWNSYQQAAAA